MCRTIANGGNVKSPLSKTELGFEKPRTPSCGCSTIAAAHLAAIDKALAGLSPRARAAFMLYRSKRLTSNEIAGELGVSPAAASAMIGAAVDVLKRCRTIFAAE